MKKAFCATALSLSLAGAGVAPLLADAQAPTPPNRIALLSLNQPPCTVPSAQAVLQAKLAYHIADGEQSVEGFDVSIKFQGVDPRMTFSMGRQGAVRVTSRHDTLTLKYPMSSIYHNARLRRPITCYFYLHRNLGGGRSTVIAKTDAIVFQECQ